MRFLFVDRILQLSPGSLVRGVKHITREDAYLCPDEAGRLCFVPSLIGETLGQLAAWAVMAANDFTLRPVAGLVASARLHRPAYLGETLLLESVIEALDDQAVQYHSVASVGSEPVFTIEGALGPLLPMSDFIDSEVVRRQFNAINRPGDWPSMNVEPLNPHLLLGQASSRAPGMFFDKIVDSVPGLSLTAQKYISGSAAYFADHFPNKPVLPLTVLLESKLNLADEFLARAAFKQAYKVSELRKIKMSEFVYPGDIVTSQIKVKQQDAQQLVLSYRSEVDGKRVCVLELVMKGG